MATNGSDVLLLVNTGTPSVPAYEAVGSQRGVTFDEETATIDASSKASRARRVDPGRYSASLSLDALYVWSNDGYQSLRDAMRNGTKILVARQDDGVTMETANAVVASMSEEFPDQEESTISIDLEVDGWWTELVS
jgi:TP901-1 family phage major tail protein